LLKKDQYINISDQDLLQRHLRENDNELLGILLSRYTLLLLGVCMKYLKNESDAKDAVQQIFLKVIKDVSRFEIVYFKSWLYMVAKNYCLMQLRNKNHHYHELDDSTLQTASDDFDFQIFLQKESKLNLLSTALQQLNSEQHLCISLFYLEKKSYQQIVDQTGFQMMQVKSHIQNGKRNLKIIMEKKIEHERK